MLPINSFLKYFQGTDEVDFAGENFVRHTGESVDFAKAQVFAWDAMDKGVDVHFQAEPTKAAVLRKTYAQKKKDHSSKLKQSVLDKYGGMEHLKVIFFISEDHILLKHEGNLEKKLSNIKCFFSFYNSKIYD